MKTILFLNFVFFSLTTFAQKMNDATGQQMTLEQWNEEAKTNIRLQPKYGNIAKTEAQKKADREFIETAIRQDSTAQKASQHLIGLGFKYLYRDIKTAMYRFNQAWLLDSTNTDVYWGFGGVYMTLGDYTKAAQWYQHGLSINPDNTHLLTDYGTYFMGQYQALSASSEKDALKHLESAIRYLVKSYQLDPGNQNTSFKLSVCYWYKSDCSNALKYHDACKKLGGKPITEDYTRALMQKCGPGTK